MGLFKACTQAQEITKFIAVLRRVALYRPALSTSGQTIRPAPSVVDLKFLPLLPRARKGTSDPKTTLEAYIC
jgi:hypothetical protein